MFTVFLVIQFWHYFYKKTGLLLGYCFSLSSFCSLFLFFLFLVVVLSFCCSWVPVLGPLFPGFCWGLFLGYCFGLSSCCSLLLFFLCFLLCCLAVPGLLSWAPFSWISGAFFWATVLVSLLVVLSSKRAFKVQTQSV